MLDTIDWEAVTDVELVELLRGGDDRAFTEIFARHRALATRVARRYVVRGEHDDVVNEAFAAMLQQVRRGRGPREHVLAYLLACVRNEAVRRAQHHARVRVTDLAWDLDRPVPFCDGLSDVVERTVLSAALAGLPARQRAALWALEVEGFRPAELTEALGLSANAVAALAYRARGALRAAYPAEHI